MTADNDKGVPMTEIRDAALNDLAAVMTAIYGPRCSRPEGGCIGCVAWAAFDMISQVTDASYLVDLIAKRTPKEDLSRAKPAGSA